MLIASFSHFHNVFQTCALDEGLVLNKYFVNESIVEKLNIRSGCREQIHTHATVISSTVFSTAQEGGVSASSVWGGDM